MRLICLSKSHQVQEILTKLFITTLFSDPSRVVYTPTIQYLPLHLSGIIHCHIESHPPFQFITWTKDKRIFDPFEMEEIQTLTNGSLLITKVNCKTCSFSVYINSISISVRLLSNIFISCNTDRHHFSTNKKRD